MSYIEYFSLSDEIARAKALLYGNETEIPANVLTVIRFCCEHRVGFILSRNIKVMSCKDARSNRVRLGHTGIPLFDELKSIVFVGVDGQGNRMIIAAHCRGHMNINVNRIIEIYSLISTPMILPESELLARFGMVFGIVNPMLLDVNSENTVVNIFDIGLTTVVAECPGTMMTNAGNHTWGIELEPNLLIKAIKGAIVDTIASPDKELDYFEVPQAVNPKSIGIITGNGPDSGIALWRKINSYFVEQLDTHFIGDISLPKVTVISLPAMGLSMELDKRDTATWETILEAIKGMVQNNVEILSLACHTTHYYTNRIRKEFEHNGRKFVSMPETTIKYIKESKLTDIALLGIGYVANLQEYSAYTELRDLDVEIVSDEVLAEFHKLGYEVKKMKNIPRAFLKFINLIKTEIKAKNVIIALTELSILYESQRKRSQVKNIIDPLDIYAKEVVRQSLSISKARR
jgi:aspartate racemase